MYYTPLRQRKAMEYYRCCNMWLRLHKQPVVTSHRLSRYNVGAHFSILCGNITWWAIHIQLNLFNTDTIHQSWVHINSFGVFVLQRWRLFEVWGLGLSVHNIEVSIMEMSARRGFTVLQLSKFEFCWFNSTQMQWLFDLISPLS